jgi:hypothetical protein
MRFKGFIGESVDTDFMETASCIGVICGKSISDSLKLFLDNGTGDVQNLLDKTKKIVGSGSYDWNDTGVKNIKDISTKDPNKVNVLFNLIVGMNEFMQDVGYKIVGTKPFFIHGSIKTYYTKEKSVFGKIKYTKDNTSDCIICDTNHHLLLKDMMGSEPDKDLKYIQTPSGIKYIQVSLKKSEAMSQLGKVTNMVKGLYDIDSTKDAVKMFTNEGIWDKIKVVASHIMSLTRGVLEKIKNLFGKVNKNHLSQFEKGMGINEAWYNSKNKKLGSSESRLTDSIVSNTTRATSLVNNEIRKLQAMVSGVNIPIKADTVGALSAKEPGDAFKIVSNYLTIKLLQEMVSDARGLQSNITRIIGEMYFGGTKLPLWKVFGYFGKKSYHYMGTLEGFLDSKNLPIVDVMGVRIKKGVGCYTITIFMLEDVDTVGKKYIQLRTGTNSSSKVTFIIEGTNKFGPIPLDKSLIEEM